MNELMKIEQVEGIETVNARELYEFLESKQDFSTWIKNRIEKYGFKKDIDFVTIDRVVEQSSGAKHLIEYYLSLDMAKHLTMLDDNEKGKVARQYFLRCEKVAKTINTKEIAKIRNEFDQIKNELFEKYNDYTIRLELLEYAQDETIKGIESQMPNDTILAKNKKLSDCQLDEIEEVSNIICEMAENEGYSFIELTKCMVQKYDQKYPKSNLMKKVSTSGERILKAIYLNSNWDNFRAIVEESAE